MFNNWHSLCSMLPGLSICEVTLVKLLMVTSKEADWSMELSAQVAHALPLRVEALKREFN